MDLGVVRRALKFCQEARSYVVSSAFTDQYETVPAALRLCGHLLLRWSGQAQEERWQSFVQNFIVALNRLVGTWVERALNAASCAINLANLRLGAVRKSQLKTISQLFGKFAGSGSHVNSCEDCGGVGSPRCFCHETIDNCSSGIQKFRVCFLQFGNLTFVTL